MSNKWIKANERLPNNKFFGFIKYGDNEKEVCGIDVLKDLIENGWNDIIWLEETEGKDILTDLAKSTENISKINDKDKWLNELRVKDEKLIDKIKYATAGMCHNDLAADRCANEATEIAVQHLTEKVKSLHNKYDHGEVNNIYNLAIFDVLEMFK